jgi:hypothetical protein
MIGATGWPDVGMAVVLLGFLLVLFWMCLKWRE